MELVMGTPDDEWLTVALETDPRVMAELGGPWTEDEARAAHRRRMKTIEDDGNWWFTVVPEEGGRPVGTIGVWASEVDGHAVSEAGWMILPEHQGRGYASEALRLLLERAKADGKWGDIHAYPGATNAASNALCRKSGFEHVGSLDVEYAGRPLKVNDWVWRAA